MFLLTNVLCWASKRSCYYITILSIHLPLAAFRLSWLSFRPNSIHMWQVKHCNKITDTKLSLFGYKHNCIQCCCVDNNIGLVTYGVAIYYTKPPNPICIYLIYNHAGHNQGAKKRSHTLNFKVTQIMLLNTILIRVDTSE